MILLVALGSSPLEVFALPNNNLTEWPTGSTNDVTSTLPEPPAQKDIVDLNQMFNYPILDYSGLTTDRPGELNVIKSLKGYVPVNDSSVAVITRDAPWQAGVMWSQKSNKINLAEPFHMISYVYLGSRGQAEKIVDGNKRAGADGITFTIHNDKKTPVANTSGSDHNTGINAYGALGNGLGVYGNNFSANTASSSNNTAKMTQGVTNGIALEFDTFYNHNNTNQHSDNDLWQFVGKEGDPNSNWGHIGINYLNELQNNNANNTGKQFGYGSDQVIKHNTMLAVGWDGGILSLNSQNGWQVSTLPQTKLADNKWHRLEVKWEPTTLMTGKLTYKIYRQGYTGPPRQLTSMTPTEEYDGNSTIDKIVDINVGKVFGVSDINNTVYWGFSGSTGYYQNNQAVQMLQLPVPYYKSGIRKVDQDGNLVKKAKFQLQVQNGETWPPVEFQKADGSGTQNYVLTGVDNGLIGVTTDLDGKVTATQLPKGTYRWVEIEAPEGYKIDSPNTPTPSDTGFELKYLLGSDNNGLPIDFDVRNIKLSQIELYKKDKDTNQPLNGVKFTISKIVDGTQSYLTAKSDNSDFEWTTTESEAKQFETGRSYFVRNGIIVEEATEDGYIRIGYIESGANLRWKEVSVPAGYDSSGTLEDSFSTPVDNKYLYQATQINSRLYQVSLEKKASDTNAALPGAVFSLQKKVDQNWETVSKDGVSEFTTNSEGKISISNLTAGTYRWEEKQAPVGYKIKQQYYPDENGFEVKYREGLEIDGISQNYNYDPTQVTNEPQDFELILEKLSSTFQRPLENVSFTLYGNREGNTFSNEISTLKTNQEGKIVFGSDLIKTDQTYYLVESQTVEGFIQLKGYFTITTSKVDGIDVDYVKANTETDLSPFEFTQKADDKYSGHLKIYNKRKSILPTTGGNGILGYVGIGLTMTIVALLFFIARKRIFKWLIILLVATSGLAGLAGGTQVVSAQEQEQVQLEVNRLVYQPSDTQYKSGVPVAGAKLEVVDVTKSFYELVNRQKLSLKEAQEAVSKSNKIDGQSLAVATTDQSGLVRFTVSKTSQQRPAVYLIRELVTPVAVTKMENMVVVLPILDESGNEKSLISLFPKSHGTFTFDKTIDEKQSSYSFGNPIPYRLSTIIPQDMTNLSSYEIEDIYDQGLRFISESLEIFIDGEKQSDSIKAVSLSENQFRVVFDVAKLADFSGKKLEVTYQMVIKDEAAIDQDLVNTATLYPGDLTPLVDRENVQTGGFRFIKRAAEGKQNPLAKATFVIKNPTDDTVLTYKEGKYQFEKVATNASGVVRLTSDDDGYFEIRGLRYGEYLVNEIRAPSGYVLQDKPTAFTVGVSTYSQGPVLSIFNVKKPKIRLPETGTVVTSTAFVGLLIMASSLVMIRRRKDN